jgi:hypothetical protein
VDNLIKNEFNKVIIGMQAYHDYKKIFQNATGISKKNAASGTSQMQRKLILSFYWALH